MNSSKYNNLVKQGYSNIQQKKFHKAYDCFNSAKIIDPDKFDAWFGLGNLHLRLGDQSQAVIALEHAIKISPDNPVAHGQMGVALYGLQRPKEAIDSYLKVVDLQPENVAAYANLAIAYIDIGRRAEAIECCKKAININPGFTGAHVLLASAYSMKGQYEKALQCYDHVLSMDPHNLNALAGKADSLTKLGNKSEAYNVLRSKIDSGILDPALASPYATVCAGTEHEHVAADYLERSLKVPGLTHMQRLQLHFSAGFLYDSMEKYDTAFQHYSTGNSLVQRTYNTEADKELFDSIINIFSNDKLNQLPRSNQHGLMPVFIVGMPRSGTSLVERILGSHSKIYAAGELGSIPDMAEQISTMNTNGRKFPYCMSSIDGDVIDMLSRTHLEYLENISERSDIVLDKLPHNFLFLGLIELLFPDARIIHCKRDPLDTCLSNYFQYFSGPLDYPYNLLDIATHYNNYVAIMEHWRKTISLPMFEINYEELVKSQESMTKSLLSFLGVNYEESCLKYNETNHVTRTASYGQVNQPIYTKSIGRWRKYEEHIDALVNNLSKVKPHAQG